MRKGLFIFIVFFVAFVLVFLFPKKITEIKKEIQKVFELKTERSTTVLFVGDMMFDRGVRNKINQEGFDFLFQNILNLFEGNDLIVGNLEGTITSNPTVAVPNSEILRFTFDSEITKFLKKYNFGLVSLANNHSLDFGEFGYEETKDNLNKVGILYFGSGYNENNISRQIVLNNKNFCFIAYHDLYSRNEKPVLEEIKNIKNECFKIVVFTHWGEEYLNTFTDRQKVLGHEFVDAGADLVVGTHPHVVEPVEIYKGKAIFYSLGNFVFDQNFSWETEHSIALKVSFENEKTSFEVVSVEINMGVVSLGDEEDTRRIWKALGVSERKFFI